MAIPRYGRGGRKGRLKPPEPELTDDQLLKRAAASAAAWQKKLAGEKKYGARRS